MVNHLARAAFSRHTLHLASAFDAIVRDAQGTMLFHYVIAQLFAVVSPDATGVILIGDFNIPPRMEIRTRGTQKHLLFIIGKGTRRKASQSPSLRS